MPSTASLDSNLPEYTVSEISSALKRTVEGTFSRVRIRGEISGLKRASSGHIYLTLKDDKAVLDGVIWRGNASALSFDLEDGLETIAEGRLTTYPARSRYQIVIDRLEPAGIGALLALLEERRKKLNDEGLFDKTRKRELPYLPSTIGVITSQTGAVFRDILHRLRDRFPTKVILWPVLVQGKGAAEQVTAAIEGFNKLAGQTKISCPDLLIVARGGGSVEDLWTFNDEGVVRATALSAIPLISAIGHETDTTLIDFAADQRAPTPTAAAEMAVPVRADLIVAVAELERQMLAATTRTISESRRTIGTLAYGLPNPYTVIGEATQRLDERIETIRRVFLSYFERHLSALQKISLKLLHPRERLTRERSRFSFITKELTNAATAVLKESSHKWRNWAKINRFEQVIERAIGERSRTLNSLAKLLESYSYQRVVERGFTVIRDLNEKPITRSAQVSDGTTAKIEFADGARSTLIGQAPNGVKTKTREARTVKGFDKKQEQLL